MLTWGWKPHTKPVLHHSHGKNVTPCNVSKSENEHWFLDMCTLLHCSREGWVMKDKGKFAHPILMNKSKYCSIERVSKDPCLNVSHIFNHLQPSVLYPGPCPMLLERSGVIHLEVPGAHDSHAKCMQKHNC